MIAVILAGGFGTRLKPLTDTTPKPLIKIGRKSILEHIIDRLNKHKIDKIIVKSHYLADQIIEAVGDRALIYYEPVLLTWRETLGNLEGWLQDDFMVVNGDTISDVNLIDMQSFHQSGTVTVLMDDWRAAGVWIYPKGYLTSGTYQVRPFRPSNLNWFDCGTPERLEAARNYFMYGKQIV